MTTTVTPQQISDAVQAARRAPMFADALDQTSLVLRAAWPGTEILDEVLDIAAAAARKTSTGDNGEQTVHAALTAAAPHIHHIHTTECAHDLYPLTEVPGASSCAECGDHWAGTEYCPEQCEPSRVYLAART